MFRRDSVRSATIPLDFTTSTFTYQSENRVRIFPNPSSGQIQLSSLARINTIKLYTLQGQLLAHFTDNLSDLDLSVYPAGVYSLHIVGEGISQNERIIIH